MRLHYLQHVPFEGLGAIEPWALKNGFTITKTSFFADEPLPPVDAIDWLVIMGGPMNIYEHGEYPWLVREKEFIGRAITAGKKTLGVCLGAQLIADVLGGRVTRNAHKEIGFFSVTLTDAGKKSPLFGALPASFNAFHWHGDTFSIPPGAIHTASSEACVNQAFTFGRNVIGLQFHIEYRPEDIDAMYGLCADELIPGGTYIRNKADTRTAEADAMNPHLCALMDGLNSR
ncbi:MAG: type 1 glutamine amidotransferase [Spirochaetes bacterium]|nr:type 1 glutamine amidotransferase [Spirochaetota bacterium]